MKWTFIPPSILQIGLGRHTIALNGHRFAISLAEVLVFQTVELKGVASRSVSVPLLKGDIDRKPVFQSGLCRRHRTYSVHESMSI